MHIHILGIGGTFMGGLAILAKQLNFKVTGADGPLYPPMSTQLESQGIELIQGYEADQLDLKPDCIVIGNVMKRGLPVIEAILDQGLPFMSGPEWLDKAILKNRHILAVSGTHGKTTTTSMLAWILEVAGLNPGFLIGGIPNNFGVSARLGKGPYFIVEADEYDSAFFDKRSKFIHYHPRTLIINNIEFDHADIFLNLDAIKTQFHHLIRTVPSSGKIIVSGRDKVIEEVLKMGVWTEIEKFYSASDSVSVSAAGLYGKPLSLACDRFEIYHQGQGQGQENKNGQPQKIGEVAWEWLGNHNMENALAAIAAARQVGVSYEVAIQALQTFKGVKRRLELKFKNQNLRVYDDFAHHPTAIQTTLEGLRAKHGNNAKILAIVDIRSNTMKAGFHQAQLGQALSQASEVYFYKTQDIAWDVEKVVQELGKQGGVFSDPNELLEVVRMRTGISHPVANSNTIANKKHVVFMSNGGFSGILQEFLMLLSDGVSEVCAR